MAFDKYFRHVPNFDYVSRLPDRKYINDYIQTKNLFKRVKLSDEIFENLNFFSKTIIKTNERPDNVAKRVYDDESLDWLILLSNNVINFESEWPMDQISFDNYILNKYGSYENMYNIHHYETQEILDGNNNLILKKGLEVPQNFSFTYFDSSSGQEVIANNITDEITNLQYEERIQEQKQSIFILKPRYLSVILNEINTLMPYKEGSTQYVGASLARGDNIRLYT
tara:strand:+ start:475 stop:1149 length:675 start_codon:yes stop_codon:yes gene_type:complete